MTPASPRRRSKQHLDAHRAGSASCSDNSRATGVDRWRHIVLTGFMGSGKTTVGRILAERLGREFVDTDQVIESRHGPIRRIVADSGWELFRAMEREVAVELSHKRGLVISTGGRMMLDSGCVASLRPVSDVVWLQADPEVIVHRLIDAPGADPAKRPLLTGGGADPAEVVQRLLRRRLDGYGRYPAVDTSQLTPEQAAAAVLRLLGLR